MLKYIIILLLVSIFTYAQEINCLKSNNQADCLNKYFYQMKNVRQITIPYGIYHLNSSIIIPSNTVFDGNKSIFEFRLKNNDVGAIYINAASNIEIKNLTISSAGVFSNNAILVNSKPYCGFSNGNSGILIQSSDHILVNNVKINGFNYGLIVTGTNNQIFSKNINIVNSSIYNIGKSGIRIVYVADAKIENNIIVNVFGNQVQCDDGWVSNAKFADGIYMESVKSVTVMRNKIDNVKRIGIVADNRYDNFKQPVFINHNLLIANNLISNVNGCRGTENNAGIWIEPIKVARVDYTKINVRINNNRVSNTHATSCLNYQYGVFSGADQSVISGNNITGFTSNGKKSIGIRCAYGNCIIKNNQITNTNIGVLFNDANVTYVLKDNIIKSSISNYIHMK